MSAVCPKCGVAVTAGYVKCPKCQSPLPSTRRGGPNSGPGGTAVAGAPGGTPVLAFVIGGAVAIGIVLFFALRKGDKSEAAPAPEPTQGSDPAQVAQPDRTDPTALPDPTPGSANAAPDPTAAVNALDRALKKERLWGTVSARGTRVEVRTAACGDPQMTPLLDANAAALRDVGLTRVRCVEQSGAVVFERDL